MGAYAGAADVRGHIDPLFRGVDGLCAGGSVGVVETGRNANGDVHGADARFLQDLLKTFQVVRLYGGEMTAVRLDVVNVEFLDDVRWKVEKVHAGHGSVAISIVGANDIGAEGIRGDGDALAGMRGKKNVRFGIGICQ